MTRKNKKINLTAIEYRLLEFMMKNEGRILSRLEISDYLWGQKYYSGTNTIDVHINSLRKKMDRGFPKQLIRTVVGMGYVLEEHAG